MFTFLSRHASSPLQRLRSRKATLEEIQTCHSESYTLLFGSSPHNRHKIDPARLSKSTLLFYFDVLLTYLVLVADLPIKSFVMLPCGGIGIDSDTTWNEMHTSGAARMAAGCVIELATRVALKEVKVRERVCFLSKMASMFNQTLSF